MNIASIVSTMKRFAVWMQSIYARQDLANIKESAEQNERVSEPVSTIAPRIASEQPACERAPCKASEQPPIDVTAKPKRASNALRNQLAEEVTNLIERITAPDIGKMHDKKGAREYEEALGFLTGCDFHYIDELCERMNGGSEWLALMPDDEMRETIWPIDIATVLRKDNGNINFTRMFTATAASLRGRARIIPQRAAWLVNASVSESGKWFAQMTPIGLINNTWSLLDLGIVRKITNGSGTVELVKRQDREIRDETNDTASIMQSIALTERYNWHVAIGREGEPRVLLPTNPRGCLELFKTRDKRDGETRRAALRHWVHNHFREQGDREINYVRDHLRGVTEFDWRGFNSCEVFVSEFDLEKNELFRLQAKEWRARRKHNRVAVRIKRPGASH